MRLSASLAVVEARTLALRAADPFWQARYYDFNVWSERKFLEKLAIFIGIQCNGGWSRGQTAGNGAAFVTM